MKSRTRSLIIALIGSWLVLFGVLPLLLLVVSSFLGQDPEAFFVLRLSLDAYRQLIDPGYLEVLLRSVRLALITTACCLVIGYPFAWLTARLDRRSRLLVLILLMIPFWTNSLVRTYAIRMVLGTQGLLNTLLLQTGLIDQPIRLLYTDTAVILGLFYLMLPFMILPLYANMEKFDYRLVEAARDLGAGFLATFRRVVWPLTWPGVLAGCIMVFVPTMGLFYVASLLGGARQLLVGNLIHQQFLNARNWPLGSATSVALIIMMTLMLAAYGLVLRKLAKRSHAP
ncbi:spermidine/putrescine ABC transporter permease PotB [Desulfofustis limnaeus]|jgi:spermidine/putrescine transport system permease protein|uniref:Spermidine/putrescine ABC transporter permease PotB n=1 Tax=Desulfofustis limnaeus TaxID=2740163 RepID=A0ABM7WD82_9BACT|nr:spermidine/putrescine ABC transporter permease PotB [Desulfofustis limnaeus]MDX9894011.1 spermidine/putrescine ABC transporter permease PotB [Desulfofustis sp.]BDD88956.1 spermidine/putrescine ABC transporter permease PotB [Desulfofustis limnaeus]